jgi:hypothetical protein
LGGRKGEEAESRQQKAVKTSGGEISLYEPFTALCCLLSAFW